MTDEDNDVCKNTYPDGDAIVLAAGWEFHNKLRASLFLGVVQRSKPTDYPNTVLRGNLTLPRRIHCHILLTRICDTSTLVLMISRT